MKGESLAVQMEANTINREIGSAACDWNRERMALTKALKVAHEAIELAVCLANEAANEWDAAPNGMKAGKILLALAGHRKGYSDKADKVNAALPIIAAALARAEGQG